MHFTPFLKHHRLCIQDPMATKEMWQNLILGCSMSLSSVSPYPRWCPCFSNSPLGRLPHSHRSSYWHAVGITADYSIPWSGAAEVSALPGRLMPMSTEALQLIRKGNPSWKAGVGKMTWEAKEIYVCVPGSPLSNLQSSWLSAALFLGNPFCFSGWVKIWSAHWNQKCFLVSPVFIARDGG